MNAVVTAVSRSAKHTLVKSNQDSIRLIARARRRRRRALGRHRQASLAGGARPEPAQSAPSAPVHAELHEELRRQGFAVSAGQMGENVTTQGVDLLGLPTGARLHLGDVAVVEVTGLRNPCAQLDRIQPGLMAATLGRDAHGNLVRKAGIMGVVIAGGEVRPGDPIRVELPPQPHRPLAPV